MKWGRTLVLLPVLCISFYNECIGQHMPVPDSGRVYFASSKFQVGHILIDNPATADLVQDIPWLLEFDFSILKNTQRSWDYCNCFSKDGFSISYINFGNPEKLGRAVNLAAFVEPYLSFSSRFQFSFRGGAGISYLNKVYDEATNPTNLFVSKHISYLLLLNLSAFYAVRTNLKINFTAQFNHISNGGARDPNYGMNLPSAGIGLEYSWKPYTLSKRKNSPFTKQSLKIITHVFGGQRILPATKGWPEESKIVFGLTTGVIKPLSKINGLGIGGELYYDGLSAVKHNQTGDVYKTVVGSASMQHYLFFGRVLFGQQLAYQFTQLNPDVSKKIYERYFLEYKIGNNWYAGISLKAYGDVSDYFTIATAVEF